MIAVLFARRDSVYKSLPECDVWDEDRDARRWPGGCPVIAHPPCRAWGGLRHMAKPAPGERELAIFALEQVRQFGGVLEHPRRSELWPVCGLPMGNREDQHGGFSLLVNQCWWGHRAEKPSLLYVCGVDRRDVPAITVNLAAPSHVIGTGRRKNEDQHGVGWRPNLSLKQREATPPDFARWLVELARHARPPARQPGQHGSLEQHGCGRADLAVLRGGELSMAVPDVAAVQICTAVAPPGRLAGHDHPGGRL